MSLLGLSVEEASEYLKRERAARGPLDYTDSSMSEEMLDPEIRELAEVPEPREHQDCWDGSTWGVHAFLPDDEFEPTHMTCVHCGAVER